MFDVRVCVFLSGFWRTKEEPDLILESRGLLLKPGRFEVVDDVGDPPVGGVWKLTVLNRAAKTAGTDSIFNARAR